MSKKIMLLFPHPISQVPGGLSCLIPFLVKNGYEVKVFINTFADYYDNNKIMQLIKSYKPDIVGLSFSTFRILHIYDLIREIKKLDILVICGGVHPSIRPQEVLEHDADIVVRGEGELTIDELSQMLLRQETCSLNRVLGISYRDQNEVIHHNPARPRIKDLDSLPEPLFEFYGLDRFRMPDGTIKGLCKIRIGRGCPFPCTFCDHSVWGANYTFHSPENVIEQISKIKKRYNSIEVGMADENFTLNKENAYRICELIIKKKLNIRWIACSHINTVDRDILGIMKQAGCYQIIYGAESGDDETLSRIRKGYTAKKIIETVKITHETGLRIYLNFMTGFPWEEPQHVENTIQVIKEVQPLVYCFQCYGAVIPYPNTPIYDEYKDEYGFKDFWLKEKFQDAGMVIYQNVENPYRVSSYFQRNLFDDTYVYEDYFFKFTSAYKKKIKEMLFLIGRHNLKAQFSSPWRQRRSYMIGKLSRFLYEIDPHIERNIVSFFSPKNVVHDSRGISVFIKR